MFDSLTGTLGSAEGGAASISSGDDIEGLLASPVSSTDDIEGLLAAPPLSQANELPQAPAGALQKSAPPPLPGSDWGAFGESTAKPPTPPLGYEERPSQVAASQVALPAPTAKRSRTPLVLAAGVLLAAVIGGGYWLSARAGAPSATPESPTRGPEPRATAPPEATTKDPAPSDTATPEAEDRASPDAGAAPKAAAKPIGSLRECVAKHFPEETFGDPTQDFAFLCSTKDPREAAKGMHRQIVVGGQGKITPGMREWSLFSWYELAAVATVQHACCEGARPELPSHEVCPALAGTLTDVAEARDAASVDRLEASIICLYDKQVPRPYRYTPRPDSGNKTAFLSFIRRAAEAK